MTRWIVLAALATGLLRAFFLTIPTSPDEGGYLFAAGQWSDGAFAYGDYFVDRPPLLMAIFALAEACGGLLALRLLGLLIVMACVLFAGRLAGLPGAVATGLLLSMPLLEPFPVNGELLTLPFILGGLICLCAWPRRRDLGWALAGVLGVCAALVKQNALDVFVVAGILALLDLRRRPLGKVSRRVCWLASGALLALLVAVAGAWLRGASLHQLLDAVLIFRVDAGKSLRTVPDPRKNDRAFTLLLVALNSVIPVVAAAAVGARSRARNPHGALAGRHDLLLAASALLLAEIGLLLLGGGFWLHYLVALVPGVVLLLSAVTPGRLVWGVLGALTISLGAQLVFSPHDPPGADIDHEVVTWLQDHSGGDDTVVVGFGHPNIVYDTGLSTPYEHLWVLPTRVRDPDLTSLASVFLSDQAPRWIVVRGDSLSTLGVDHRRAQAIVDERYRQAVQLDGWLILERTPEALH